MRRDLLDPAGVHHFQLCEVLKFMGPEARDAFPILSTLALHGMSVDARYHAMGLFGHMKSGENIPVLCKVLETETNPVLQVAALWAIMNSGGPVREAIPHVLKLADAPYEVGEQAVRTLAHLDTEQSNAALLSIINDRRRDECVRCAAILALRNTTAKREGIVPHLVKALKDPEPSVRWNAVVALSRSATPSTTPVIVQSVMPLTLDGEPRVRIRSLEAIHQLNPENQFVIPKLLQEARHPSLDVRYEALCGLRRLDPHMRISTDVFCKALTDYRPKVRRLATIHLAAQQNNAIAPYFPLLLTDRDRDIRRLAKKAFDQLSKPNNKKSPLGR
jgi:HEAT repeat protein